MWTFKIFRAALLIPLVMGASAQAQILIGQTAGFSGTVAAGVKETTDGAKLYIDDKFDPKLAAENARKLIVEKNVAAMFLTRGTPHSEAIIPLLDQYGVTLIAPSTGAMSLHQPVRKHVFNVRATYQREAEKAVLHLASTGINRIAVIYVDDSFGNDGLAGAQRGLENSKLKAAVLEKLDRAKPDFSKIAPDIVNSGAQATLVIASGSTVVDAIKALRAAGSTCQVVTLSNNASGGFIKSLGEQGRGVIVSQVFPQSISFTLVKEAGDLARAKGMHDVSPAALEGFAAAKVLVEALRRTNGKPTRDRIQSALEGMSKFDLGGLEISFSPKDHSGLDFSDLSIITADGRFRR
jgi:branched-chain amino acid transport system substrate-binding protein